MPSVTKSVDATTAPEAAFAVASDPARFGEWLTLHDSWPQGAPTDTSTGAQFTQKLKIMGMPADVAWTVARKDDTSLEMTGSGPMGATLATTISAAPSGDGTTLSYTAEFSGGGIQGPMGDIVTKKAGEELDVSLAKLQGLL